MKTKILLSVMIYLGCVFPVQAEDILDNIEIGGLRYYIATERKEAWLQDEGSSTGRVDIPESVEYEGETYDVTAILGGFAMGSTVTVVQIPKTVRYITKAAFQTYDYTLKETHITDLAAWCGIENHGMPQYHSCNLFLNGKEITDLVIPDGVEVIGYGAFCGLYHVTSITFPDGLTSIGEVAFAECRGVTGHVDIPQSVTQIEREAFYNMKNIESVSLPDGLTEIKKCVFTSCSSLQNVKFPEQLITIGKRAFAECFKLKNIVLPDKVETIGEEAFADCYGMEKIVLGKVVKSIGKKAFARSIIKEIVLPESIEQIKSQAFACPNLECVFCYAETVPKCEDGAFASYQNMTLYVPRNAIEDYKKDAVWGKFGKIEAIEGNPNDIETLPTPSPSRNGGECYDLQGRRLPKIPQKGIFIQDGKKIVK